MRSVALSSAFVMLSMPLAAVACATFGRDAPAVDEVQSSWGPAEKAMSEFRYAEALRRLNSTYAFVSKIRKPIVRRCVGDGARLRIASARAGESFLIAHPGDDAGAKREADLAWATFPMRHDCP